MANARPWLQQRDAGDDSEIDSLLDAAGAGEDSDQPLRERAWQQHEHEQQQRADQ